MTQPYWKLLPVPCLQSLTFIASSKVTFSSSVTPHYLYCLYTSQNEIWMLRQWLILYFSVSQSQSDDFGTINNRVVYFLCQNILNWGKLCILKLSKIHTHKHRKFCLVCRCQWSHCMLSLLSEDWGCPPYVVEIGSKRSESAEELVIFCYSWCRGE